MEQPIETQEQQLIITNKWEAFIPVEFAIIDYQRSWKKCRCGRITNLRDNWCPSCGQKLGFPEIND